MGDGSILLFLGANPLGSANLKKMKKGTSLRKKINTSVCHLLFGFRFRTRTSRKNSSQTDLKNRSGRKVPKGLAQVRTQVWNVVSSWGYDPDRAGNIITKRGPFSMRNKGMKYITVCVRAMNQVWYRPFFVSGTFPLFIYSQRRSIALRVFPAFRIPPVA